MKLFIALLLCTVSLVSGQTCDPNTFAVGQGSGPALLAVNTSGFWACGGKEICADIANAQRRVTGTCGLNQFVTSINADGTVGCTSGNNGDITSVTTGVGLIGGGVTGDVTINVNTTYLQRRVTTACGTGAQHMTAIDANGIATCVANAWVSTTSDITRNTGKVLIGGISSTVNATLAVRNAVPGQAAVLGENAFIPTTKGMLGVQAGTNYEGANLVGGEEIGVFGVSSGGSSTDNYGVYGYSNGNGVTGQHSTQYRGSLGTSTEGAIGTNPSGTHYGKLGTALAGVETDSMVVNTVRMIPLVRGVSTNTVFVGSMVAGVTRATAGTGHVTFTRPTGWTTYDTVLITPYQSGTGSLDTCQYSISTTVIDVYCFNTPVGGTPSLATTVFSIFVIAQ